MGEEMSAYEEERLELEQEKVKLLRQIRKDIRHERNLDNLYKIVDRLEVDREDIDKVIQFVGEQLEARREEKD